MTLKILLTSLVPQASLTKPSQHTLLASGIFGCNLNSELRRKLVARTSHAQSVFLDYLLLAYLASIDLLHLSSRLPMLDLTTGRFQDCRSDAPQ